MYIDLVERNDLPKPIFMKRSEVINIRLFTSYLIAGLVLAGTSFNGFLSAQPGNAINFDGNNDYVEVSDDQTLRQTTFTLETWFKTGGGSDAILTMVNRQASGSFTKRNFWLVIDNGFNFGNSSPGAVSFRSSDGSSVLFTLSTDASNNYDYRDGNWHHVAVVVDDNNNSAEMFLDGVSVDNLSYSGNVWVNSAPMLIGKENGSGRHFKGDIDEMRFWSNTRTQTEIQKYMHQSIDNPTAKSSLKAYYDFNSGSGSNLEDKSTSGSNNGNNGTLKNSPQWASSDAPLTNATSKLGVGNTYYKNLKGIWSVRNTATSEGLKVSENGNNPFGAGDHFVFAHNGGSGRNTTNKTINTVAGYSGSSTVESRLNRRWHIDENAGGKNVDLTFKVTNAGVTRGINNINSASDYVLIQTDLNTNKIVQSGQSGSSSNNTVSFTNVDINSTYTLGTTNESGSSLPVELTHFKARKAESQVVLDWATASETNNSHFLVQRKTGDAWQALGRVEGHGTSTEARHYTFTDDKPQEGANYYRLKQVDFDGSTEYSKIKSVKFSVGSGASGTIVKVLENPVQENLRLNIQSQARQNMTYHLLNGQGRLVRKGQWTLKEGQQGIRVNAQDLHSGTYFLKVQTGDTVITKKLIK